MCLVLGIRSSVGVLALPFQGRRRLLKSGTAIERRMRSARAEGGTSGGGSTRGG